MLRVSSAQALSYLNYLVLDEVDSLIEVVGKYSSNDQRRMIRGNKGPTSEIISVLMSMRRQIQLPFEEIQIVAASATVGRPLRRELYKLLHSENIAGGKFGDMKSNRGQTAYGDFPVIRGNTAERNNAAVAGIRSDSSPAKEMVEQDGEGSGGGVTRYVSIPRSICHIALLGDDDDDPDQPKKDLIRRLADAKSFWESCSSRKAMLFVPHYEDVTYVMGVLRFWGVPGVVDMQSNLGLAPPEFTKTLAPDRRPSTASEVLERVHRSGVGLSGSRSLVSSTALEAPQNQSPEIIVLPASGTRGLHVENVDFVFLLFAPKVMDEYLHLAGRTGRSGRSGTVVTMVNLEQLKRLRSWQEALGVRFDVKTR